MTAFCVCPVDQGIGNELQDRSGRERGPSDHVTIWAVDVQGAGVRHDPCLNFLQERGQWTVEILSVPGSGSAAVVGQLDRRCDGKGRQFTLRIEARCVQSRSCQFARRRRHGEQPEDVLFFLVLQPTAAGADRRQVPGQKFRFEVSDAGPGDGAEVVVGAFGIMQCLDLDHPTVVGVHPVVTVGLPEVGLPPCVPRASVTV